MSSRMTDLEYLINYCKNNNLENPGKITDIELSFEEVVKIYYPNIDFEKSFILFHSGGIAGGEYPVLTVYFTSDEKWIFQISEQFFSDNHKFIFVEHEEFPMEILRNEQIGNLLLGKKYLEIWQPKFAVGFEKKIPYKFWYIDANLNPVKELNFDYFCMSFIDCTIEDIFNWALDNLDTEKVLEDLKNYKIEDEGQWK